MIEHHNAHGATIYTKAYNTNELCIKTQHY